MTDPARRQQAHNLIDSISLEQPNAGVGFLEVMSTSLSRRPALAPPEDELISDAEKRPGRRREACRLSLNHTRTPPCN